MRTLRIGILATELFDERLGGFGGFGFAARRTAEMLVASKVPLQPVFIPGRRFDGPQVDELAGIEVLNVMGSRLQDIQRFRRADLDVIISIDWRPGFRYVTRVAPRASLIIWIHAPVSYAQRFSMRSLEPGDRLAACSERSHQSNLRSTIRESHVIHRKVGIATTSTGLIGRFASAHNTVLPHVNPLGYGLPSPTLPSTRASTHPKILVLGRLAPEKRPWLVGRLAHAIPDVEFRIAGSGDSSLFGLNPPSNVSFLGHLDDESKNTELSQASVLLNTSVTEGLPISFIEALLAGLPLVSTVNPDRLASRFGSHVENVSGHGMELINPLQSSLMSLVMLDEPSRNAIGGQGRRWALEHHSVYAFYRDFAQLLSDFGHHEQSQAVLEVALERLRDSHQQIPTTR